MKRPLRPRRFDSNNMKSRPAGRLFIFKLINAHTAGRAPTQDNLLVFYLPDEDEWSRAVDRVQGHGYTPVRSYNPYWDMRGKTFEDPDGYRVVLQNAGWDV